MNRLDITRFPQLDYSCAEAMNSLCTNLTFCGSDIRSIMLTSCRAGEGKSFLTMNIGRTMAELGKKVVTLDCDLRRSNAAATYGLDFGGSRGFGIVHYLAGKCEIDEILYQTNIFNLHLVPAGRTVANPLPLLNSERFPMLLEELAKMFDYVLVDVPPVGIVIDAAEIAKSCDGTLFVVKCNGIRRRELSDARQQIGRTGCAILGAVLNQVTFDSYSTKRYYNKSYYYQTANKKRSRLA